MHKRPLSHYAYIFNSLFCNFHPLICEGVQIPQHFVEFIKIYTVIRIFVTELEKLLLLDITTVERLKE
jgi:hypothetical protein